MGCTQPAETLNYLTENSTIGSTGDEQPHYLYS